MAKDSRNVVRTKDAGVFFGKIVSKENTAAGIVVRIEKRTACVLLGRCCNTFRTWRRKALQSRSRASFPVRLT